MTIYITDIIVVLLVIAGFFIPIRWILRVWLDEHVVRAPLAVLGLAAHIAIVGSIPFQGPLMSGLIVFYCGLLLAAIVFIPVLGLDSPAVNNSRMVKEDIAKYEQLLKRHPENAAAHAALGDAYLQCGRYDEAIAELETAIALDPVHSKNEIHKLYTAHTRKRMQEEIREKTPWQRLRDRLVGH